MRVRLGIAGLLLIAIVGGIVGASLDHPAAHPSTLLVQRTAHGHTLGDDETTTTAADATTTTTAPTDSTTTTTVAGGGSSTTTTAPAASTTSTTMGLPCGPGRYYACGTGCPQTATEFVVSASAPPLAGFDWVAGTDENYEGWCGSPQ